MRVIQDFNFLAQVRFNKPLHFFGEGAGVAYGRAFKYTAGKNYGIRTLFHKFSCPQHRLFCGTAPAVCKTDYLYFFRYPLKTPVRFFTALKSPVPGQ